VAKFILLYNGPATPMEEMTSEQGQAVLEKWQAWMGRVGDALIDVGAPMANGEAIVDDGSSGTAAQRVHDRGGRRRERCQGASGRPPVPE
jgi:hypothetical protein